MKEAMDRAAPCPTTVDAWLMKYAGRSEEDVMEMRGSFEEHCAARTVLALKAAGAVFPDPTDKAFRAFKDSIVKLQEEKPDGDEIVNETATSPREGHRAHDASKL